CIFGGVSYFNFESFGFVKFVLRFLLWLDFLFQKPNHWLRVSSVILSFSNELLGVVSPFSTALFVPSGFSERRFKTTPDLSFLKHVKLVLAKRKLTSNQSFGLGN
ncbi:hypothetical protein, partial [Vibrio parahaemolyticus]|uniref:hypothetical protein n=1 Tax=Vibrio parahaemolyticus TaxID=670 RepID=UPI001C4E58E1